MSNPLRRTGFRDLFIGQSVSAWGDWIVTIALMALVADLSGSSAAVGGILVLRLFPAMIAGPLAARAAQRWDRRTTMLAMDVVRGAIVAIIPIVSAVWWVYVWAFVLEAASIVFLPARDSSVPDLVDEADLPVANGLVLASSYGTIPLGAGAFAAIAALTPSGWHFAPAFWFDALTYAVSFWFITRLHGLGRAEGDVAPEGEHGFRGAFRIPLVRAVLAPVTTVVLGLGALFSLGVKFVQDVLSASTTQFGVLIALFGVGALIGLLALRALAGVDDLLAVRGGVFIQGVTIAVMSASPNVEIAFLGAAAFGGATAFTLAAGMSALQANLEGEERVLAFSAFHVVIRGGLSLAAIGAGVAADLLDKISLPVFGTVSSVRVVLGAAGVVVILGSILMRTAPAGHHAGDVRLDPH